jgi:hypothetical protein
VESGQGSSTPAWNLIGGGPSHTMKPAELKAVEDYLHALYLTHSSGAGVDETSHYGALQSLLNEIGKGLKPRVRCPINL